MFSIFSLKVVWLSVPASLWPTGFWPVVKWSWMFCTPTAHQLPKLKFVKNWPRCTSALPIVCFLSGSRPTSVAAKLLASLWSTTPWTPPRNSNPSSGWGDKELLSLQQRPPESKRRAERTGWRKSGVPRRLRFPQER